MQKKEPEIQLQNMATSVGIFERFGQHDYARAVSLQVSQLLWMKKTNHPVWNLFVSQPDILLEVKGEWSLSRLTTILLKRNNRMNIDKAEELYHLTKLVGNQKRYIYDDDTNFFGYDSIKHWSETDPIVLKVQNFIEKQIRKITNDKECIYHEISAKQIFYGTYNSIIRGKPSKDETLKPIYTKISFTV